eukprot:Hpha_TRINITY_DN8133_c0_g1::TRINITY_DN8133_c0_g1_i1::g.172091::m.172091
MMTVISLPLLPRAHIDHYSSVWLPVSAGCRRADSGCLGGIHFPLFRVEAEDPTDGVSLFPQGTLAVLDSVSPHIHLPPKAHARLAKWWGARQRVGGVRVLLGTAGGEVVKIGWDELRLPALGE